MTKDEATAKGAEVLAEIADDPDEPVGWRICAAIVLVALETL